MVIEMHDVLVVQSSVQLDLSVNLQSNTAPCIRSHEAKVSDSSLKDARALRSPCRAGAVWRRARAG